MSEKWFYSGGVDYSCDACSLYANDATGAGATGINGGGFNILYIFTGYSAPCQWNWGIVNSLSLTRNAITGAWTFTAISFAAINCYRAVFAAALINCAGGSISGAYPLPATGNDPLCTGILTITLP